MKPDGSVTDPVNAGFPASNMTVESPDNPQFAGSRLDSTTSFTMCTCGIGGRPFTFSYASDTQPALRSRDHESLGFWFDGAQASGGNVVAERLQILSSSQFDTVPPVILGAFAGDSGRDGSSALVPRDNTQ